jgi:hypothetical protein
MILATALCHPSNDLPEDAHFLKDYKLPCPSLVMVRRKDKNHWPADARSSAHSSGERRIGLSGRWQTRILNGELRGLSRPNSVLWSAPL